MKIKDLPQDVQDRIRRFDVMAHWPEERFQEMEIAFVQTLTEAAAGESAEVRIEQLKRKLAAAKEDLAFIRGLHPADHVC